jgi:cation diffusion facilitator CzcD-associated flavoprotein CzcO
MSCRLGSSSIRASRDLSAAISRVLTPLPTSAAEYPFDIIIYATGFDAITGSFDRIDVRGVGGLKLKDRWAHGPLTYLGVLVEGFPNMMMVMGPHTALGNIFRAASNTMSTG